MAIKKKSDKKVTSVSALITFGIYALIALVFWNVGGDKIIKDIVVKATSGSKPKPPPPPKKAPPKIQINQPPKIRPKFTVVQPKFASSSIKPDFGKSMIPVMDNEGDLGNITRMAKMYEMSSVTQNMNQMKTASLDIGSKLGFGLGDIAGGKGSMVVGTGKRVRAKLTLAMWGENYWIRHFQMHMRLQKFINENTNIQIDPSFKQLEEVEVFKTWYLYYEKKGASISDLEEMDRETEFLKRLGSNVGKLVSDKSGYKTSFSDNIKLIWRRYLEESYPNSYKKKGESLDALIGRIKKDYKLAPYQQKDMPECNRIISEFTPNMATTSEVQNQLPFIYDYIRRTVMLHYRFVFSHNYHRDYTVYGGEMIVNNEQNCLYMRNYCLNGGFFYLDEVARPQPDYKLSRQILGMIMKNDINSDDEKIYNKTFADISKEDRKLAGYDLGVNSPNPFHPKTIFPYSVPKKCDLTMKIFNRIGSLVRTIVLKDVEPGRYSEETGKLKGIIWDCKDDGGQPVESGVYFARLESGLFQKTRRIEMSELRKLDEDTHPMFTSFFQFKGTPKCMTHDMWVTAADTQAKRPYGTASFGWSIGDRTVLIYTEWAGILRFMEELVKKEPYRLEQAHKFFTNILVYGITQPTSIPLW